MAQFLYSWGSFPLKDSRFSSAPFFESCINEQDLDEMNIEIIRNTLYKSYLEAFYNFCKNIGGETQDVMCEILAVREQICVTSFIDRVRLNHQT